MPKTVLSRVKPTVAVGYALVFAFLLFLTFDLLEAHLLNQPMLSVPRLIHFLRGFVATASGMLFVWIIMHKKERELLSLRDRLSGQLTDRTNKLAEVQADVLAVISHRLRTPILANKRAADLLIHGDFGVLSDAQKQILKLLIANNDDVLRLLDMLADIYKYQTGTKHLNKSEIELEQIIDESAKAVNGRTKTGEVALIVESASAKLSGDPDELKKLIHHLLENATKHARSTVRLNSCVNDGVAEIMITDDGPGMHQEDVDGLFDRFYHMSSAGKYAAATGVGLCLCARIAEAHNGTVKCKSKLGEGTTFVLTLPHPHPAAPTEA